MIPNWPESDVPSKTGGLGQPGGPKRAFCDRLNLAGGEFENEANWLPGLDKLRNWLRDYSAVMTGIVELNVFFSLTGQNYLILKANPTGPDQLIPGNFHSIVRRDVASFGTSVARD